MKRCNFKQIQTGSNVIRNVKCLCSDGIPECSFLSFSSPASFLKFTSLKGPTQLRPLQCNGPGVIIKAVTSDSPRLSSPIFFLFISFPTPPLSPPLIITGWLSLFQQSFSGSLINCLLSVCGVGHSMLHTFTSSAGLFSAALWSPFCKSSDKIVELRWQMEWRCIL